MTETPQQYTARLTGLVGDRDPLAVMGETPGRLQAIYAGHDLNHLAQIGRMLSEARLSRLTLMTQVWGYSSAVVSRTVDTHVAELRRKLEDTPSAPRHILTVRKVGYRLQD